MSNIIEVDYSDDSDSEPQQQEKRLPIDIQKIKEESKAKPKRTLTQEQIDKRNASLAKAREVKKQMLDNKSKVKGRRLTKDEREVENRRSLERIELMLEKLLPAREVKEALREVKEDTRSNVDIEKEIEKALKKQQRESKPEPEAKQEAKQKSTPVNTPRQEKPKRDFSIKFKSTKK